MLVNDVALCARENNVLDGGGTAAEEGSHEKCWNGCVKSNTKYTCLNRMPAGSVNVQFSGWHRSSNSNIWEAHCIAMETWKLNKRTRCG